MNTVKAINLAVVSRQIYSMLMTVTSIANHRHYNGLLILNLKVQFSTMAVHVIIYLATCSYGFEELMVDWWHERKQTHQILLLRCGDTSWFIKELSS